jgi:hypothetical protein
MGENPRRLLILPTPLTLMYEDDRSKGISFPAFISSNPLLILPAYEKDRFLKKLKHYTYEGFFPVDLLPNIQPILDKYQRWSL